MRLLEPTLPAFDLDRWRALPYAERLRAMCQAWALQGFGAPPVVYTFYVAKLVVYVGGWLAFAAVTPALGAPGELGSWWSSPLAFQKAVVWTMLFESLGLGAATGPLTGRYHPVVGGFLYFLRPGTVRLPPWPRLTGTAGDRRTVLDVGLYVLYVALAVRALLAPELGAAELLPLALVLPMLGLRDKTILLAARFEHYWVTTVVLLFPGDALAGAKLVMVALWWGAATSKLNHHFPSVIAVMMSNSPLLRWQRAKRAMYASYPDDLRPSRLAAAIAHGGTVIEYAFPLVLVTSTGGWPTAVALAVMTAFHLTIITAVPLGVPLEWNVFFVYAAFVLFGAHAEVSALTIDDPVLVALLAAGLLLGPVLGNLRPDLVSFLPSMRYYAGNWATSFWLLRPCALERIDRCVVKVADVVQHQLRRFYDDTTATALLGKAIAFRSMHLHGRALNALLPQAVEDLEDYEVNDGEWIAGVVLGWNFGDGHLHHERLLAALQARCGFAPGDVVGVFVESQPIHRQRHAYRIVDAATGPVDVGEVDVRWLLDRQPWPDRAEMRPPAR